MQNNAHLKLSGITYIIIFFSAIFANFMMLEQTFIKVDPQATFDNLLNGLTEYKLGVAAFILTMIIDVILSWSLYYIFKNVNKEL